MAAPNQYRNAPPHTRYIRRNPPFQPRNLREHSTITPAAPKQRSDALAFLPLGRMSAPRQRITRSGVARQSLAAEHFAPVPNSRDDHAIWRLHLTNHKADGETRCRVKGRAAAPRRNKSSPSSVRRRTRARCRTELRCHRNAGRRNRDHDARKGTSHHSMLKSVSTHGVSQKGTNIGCVAFFLSSF